MDSRTMAEKYKSELMRLYCKRAPAAENCDIPQNEEETADEGCEDFQAVCEDTAEPPEAPDDNPVDTVCGEQPAPSARDTEESMGDSTGYILVNVRAGHGAYPIEGAAVVVSATTGGKRLIFAAAETDISGATLKLEVPAPDVRYSQTPDPEHTPYSLYDVTVTAEGYAEARSTDVYVFPNITSVQDFELIPEM